MRPSVTEIAAGLGGVLISFWLLSGTNAVFASALAVLAVYVAAVDLDRFVIPDIANGVMFVAGLGFAVFDAAPDEAGSALGDALLRAIGAGAVLYGLRFLYRRAAGIEGLGLGDVKLAAAGAPWLAWPLLPIALLIAAIAALLATGMRVALRGEAVTRQSALPFGAFFAPAIWLTFLLERVSFLGD